MSEKLRESLSAAVDDEADEFELRRVLDEMSRDPQLRASWARYHLIGAALRGEAARNPESLRDRVWDALHDDSVVPEAVGLPDADDGASSTPGAGRRYSGLAVAASVAFAVVIGVGTVGEWGGGSVTSPAELAADPEVRAQQDAINQAVALSQEVTAQDQTRTEAYRLYHMQSQGMNQPGPGAFVRMVTYQKQ